jgi:hypothetical protein
LIHYSDLAVLCIGLYFLPPGLAGEKTDDQNKQQQDDPAWLQGIVVLWCTSTVILFDDSYDKISLCNQNLSTSDAVTGEAEISII